MMDGESPSASAASSSGRPISSVTLFLGIVLVSVALYLPTVRSEFLVLDDPQYTTGNPYILYPSWGKLAAFFTEVFKPTVVAGYYQPLTMASLMLDRVIEGHWAGAYTPRLDPTMFHLTNILLHGLCGGLVFLLLYRICESRWIALVAALVFAVHPLNVESVAWVCQRKALLSTLFVLLMILAYLHHGATGRRVWLILSAIAFSLSMLSKPTGLFAPLVLVLLDVWPLGRRGPSIWKEKIPLFVIALIGGWVAYVSQTTAIDDTQAGQHRGVLLTAMIACHNLAFYAAKIVLPIRLCPNYIAPPESEITPLAWPYAGGLIFSAVLVVVGLRAFRRRDHVVWTMLVAFLLLLGPTLGPVRFTNVIAADRFAYLPMIALLVLVCEVVRRHSASWRRAIRSVGLAIVIVFSVVSWRQQGVWKNSVTFYKAILERFPDSSAGLYGLGNAYLDRYERSFGLDTAIQEEQRALWLDEARTAYRRTLEVDPTFSNAYYRLGYLQILQGRTTDGIKLIQRGLNQPRATPEGYFFLGTAYSHAGDYAEAIAPYEKCLQFRPSWIEVRRNLANALLRTGRAAEAIPQYERLYELAPTDLDGVQNWAIALIQIGKVPSAMEKLKGIIAIRSALAAKSAGGDIALQASKLADALYTLAGAMAMTGDESGAVENLRRASEIKPELLKQARENSAFDSIRGGEAWKRLYDEKK